jgi:hypothetical protein
VVGRFVDVIADLTTVTISCADKVVGRCERCWARRQTITDAAHRFEALELTHRARHAEGEPAPPAALMVEAGELSGYHTVCDAGEVA